MAIAMDWVARISTIALEMVLPGVAGLYLDQWLGTRFLVLLGFALGFAVGFWHLLTITKAGKQSSPTDRAEKDRNDKDQQP